MRMLITGGIRLLNAIKTCEITSYAFNLAMFFMTHLMFPIIIHQGEGHG